MIGIFTAIMIVPGLPEMVESMLPLYPGQEREVNETSSGIFNAFLGLGQVMAPAYGSTMMEHFGFRLTTDWVAIIALSFALIYFIFGSGIEAIQTTRKNFRSKENQLLGNSSEGDANFAFETVSHAKSLSSKFGLLSFKIPVPKSPSIFSK